MNKIILTKTFTPVIVPAPQLNYTSESYNSTTQLGQLIACMAYVNDKEEPGFVWSEGQVVHTSLLAALSVSLYRGRLMRNSLWHAQCFDSSSPYRKID